MHPAITRIPRPAATQLNGLHPPKFRARSAGSLKMLTPTIEFTIKAVKLQRPIVRTNPCGLSVNLNSFENYFAGTATGAAFIFTISVNTSVFPEINSRCGYFSPP